MFIKKVNCSGFWREASNIWLRRRLGSPQKAHAHETVIELFGMFLRDFLHRVLKMLFATRLDSLFDDLG